MASFHIKPDLSYLQRKFDGDVSCANLSSLPIDVQRLLVISGQASSVSKGGGRSVYPSDSESSASPEAQGAGSSNDTEQLSAGSIKEPSKLPEGVYPPGADLMCQAYLDVLRETATECVRDLRPEAVDGFDWIYSLGKKIKVGIYDSAALAIKHRVPGGALVFDTRPIIAWDVVRYDNEMFVESAQRAKGWFGAYNSLEVFISVSIEETIPTYQWANTRPSEPAMSFEEFSKSWTGSPSFGYRWGPEGVEWPYVGGTVLHTTIFWRTESGVERFGPFDFVSNARLIAEKVNQQLSAFSDKLELGRALAFKFTEEKLGRARRRATDEAAYERYIAVREHAQKQGGHGGANEPPVAAVVVHL